MSARRTIVDLLAEARTRIERLEPDAAWRATTGDAVLVDLRCDEDRRRHGVVPWSIHVPRTVLEWRADPSSPWRDPRIADLDARLVLMCSDGFSSSLAAAALCDIGFPRVADVVGGFSAWKEHGLPITHLTADPGSPWP
jgi:rhodanese-related sulfurtransferase